MTGFSRLMLALRHVRRTPEVFRCMREIENWQQVVSAYVGIARPTLPFDVRFRDGMRVHIEEFYDLETLWQIFFHGVYDVRPSDRIIIDAGANIGLFASYAARRSPSARIFCIEPFPATFERLRQTMRATGFEKRAECFNIALSATDGVAAMSASGGASQMFRLETGSGAGSVAVRTVSLQRFLADIQADTVDLLKVDIEGSEFDVLLTTP